MERPNDQSSPPNQSPGTQNLSYHQQQQHMQRTGAIQRLTADLAGLQFNDPEALFKQAPTERRARPAKSIPPGATRSPQVGSKSSKTLKQAPTYESAPINVVEALNKTQDGQTTGGYEDQMVMSSSGSQVLDFDPAKDALETADDANILKKYKIVNLVGTGNYARVYKALSPSGKEVAVKSINLNKTSDNYKHKFLPRELSILKKVNHVNICKIYEILQVADRIFIVMQFCQRGTIADLLHKVGPLGEPIARNLFSQTVDAVLYMHTLDLAHRDLKVENILLDQDYCPKLTDFSYSIFTSDKQQCQNSLKLPRIGGPKQVQPAARGYVSRLNDTFCGTLPYLSPEMIRQIPYDSKKTDIWSLGVCLYVMLNDRLPFPFQNIKLMLKKQLTKDYKFKANVEFSELSKEFVSQMLEPDQTRRLSCLEVSRHMWMNGAREKPSP